MSKQLQHYLVNNGGGVSCELLIAFDLKTSESSTRGTANKGCDATNAYGHKSAAGQALDLAD